MISSHLLIFILCLLIGIVNSLKHSIVTIWSKQREIEDFVLHKQTNEIYVAATFLYHLDGLEFVVKSEFENHEYTATDVITFQDSNTGFACSDLTGHCFLFNRSDVSQIEVFEKNKFIPNSVSNIPIPDLDLLPVNIRGSESLSFLIASEETGSKTYYTRMHPYSSFSNSSLSPVLSEVFAGRVNDDKIIRRTLLSYTREGFIYYVVRQKEISGQYSLYLMRICENEDAGDTRIHSLVEIQLNPCDISKAYSQHVSRGQLNQFFGEVLLVTFISGEFEIDSNICVYTQNDIDSSINNTIQNCFDGSSATEYILPWINMLGGPAPCSTGMPYSFCNLCNVMTPQVCLLYNYTGISGTEISGYNQTIYNKITSLYPISIDEVDLIFTGNEIGKLTKYELTSYNSIRLLEELNLENLLEAPFSKMLASSTSEYLYASRSTLLYKINIDNCHLYTTCQECVDTEDPVCGYCSLTETCTRKSECANPNLAMRWITNDSSNCLSLNSITPSLAQIGEIVEVALSIENLPQLQSPYIYQCDFAQYRTNVSRIITSGVSVNLTGPDTAGHSDLFCYVPKKFEIPNDYQLISFSLVSAELNNNFASQPDFFAFYNCSFHFRCDTCSDSPAPCFWCLYNSICTDSGYQCQMDSLPLSSTSVSCPAVRNTSDLSVHIGNSTYFDVLELDSANAPEPRGGFNYSCVYIFNSTVVVRNGIWRSETQVDCVPPPRLYSPSGSETAELLLKWGKNGMYYDITEEPIKDVTLFNCEVFEQTCSSCIGFGAKFGCGNCYESASIAGDPTCRLESQCNNNQTFLDSSKACPDPTILNFEPKGGHIVGGTPLVITGENLGGSEADLAVLVANVSCEITNYEIGKKISCITGPFSGVNPIGLITVSVKDKIINSTDSYRYLLPNMTSVHTYYPNNSLSSELNGVTQGGTVLFIRGNNLGLVTSVTIKNDFECVIQNSSTPTALESGTIICTTQSSSEATHGIITLTIGEEKLSYQQDLFSYENLQIIEGLTEFIIPAGGINIKIKVDKLESLHHTRLLIVDNNVIISDTKCTEISSAKEIICLSPLYTYSEDLVAQLVIDNLTLVVPDIEFKVRNPTCEQNPTYTDSIIIKGTDFLFVAEEYYSISITSSSDTVNCFILIYLNNTLECRPDQEISGILFVQIGSNLNCTFSSPVSPESNINQYIISGSSTLLLMLILSVFLITCFGIVISFYKYKKVREIEGLIHHYSKMESNIAKECKTGFAELQVEIVDFVQAAETNTIPFTDYQTYVVKLLFSRNQFVDFLSLPPTDPLKANEDIETFRRAMKLFQELFNNKDFLVEMIRVFDQSHNFDANEKTYFASLLMVALHKNLFYATEILKVLIDDLITGSLNKPQQELKTLFRSTSVCEKLLSHWLALCLYNYIKGRPGEELYNLYSAIKVQINKGPIDAITGEAKYSLNQDNILRMTFEVNEFEILCHFGDNFENTKLLDCDTISQVKRKIIDTLNKNMLASEKPDPDQLELIFVKPKDFSPNPKRKHREDPNDLFSTDVFTNPIYSPGDETIAREIPTLTKVKQPYLLFRDIDKTSGLDVGWRRINTMKHYFTFYNIPSPQHGSLLLMQQSNLQDNFPSLYNDTLKRKSIETPPKIFHFSIPGSPEATLDRQRVVSEVYFTKLLSTKAILQKYIDEMMGSIFPDRITLLEYPIAIKHLFDFLDERARAYNITDPEVIHTWKNNSVVLRFWVNMLKNPQFILDIDMPPPVDSTLSTIAQGLIDSCSTRNEELTKDSPANKLLFAKDTKLSKKKVKKFYEDLQNFHQTQSSFNQHLRQMQLTNSPFFVDSAIQEIFLVWISGASFVGNLMTRLREQNMNSQIAKFTQVLNMLSDNPTYDDATIL